MKNPIEYAQEHQAEFLEELRAFLAIPSISTKPEHRADVAWAAQWLRDRLLAVGFPRAEIMPTPRHPIVYAEWLAAGPEAPTVLIYGHYDVQPADPVALWHTPPFEATVVGDDLFGRGTSDDKGQLYVHVKAAEAFKETWGTPPVNLKCIYEGEEEIGSPSLDPFVRDHRDLLAADIALISDTHILGKDVPAIIYALRGLAYIEVEVTSAAADLHSGIYGGAVHNPIHALAHMITQLQDPQGRILVPGFLDKVRPLTAEDRAEIAQVPFNREEWLKDAGVKTDWGDPDYTIMERITARPTLDVNGIWGGYIESGAKTVLPSKAYAKISMRLVPDQQSAEVTRQISNYLKSIAPSTVTVEVRDLHGGEGAIVQRDSPAMKAAFRAYTSAWGVEPVFMREGGSIPVVATFQRELGIETILMGFGLPDDRLHAPDEKIHLPNLYKGIALLIYFMEYLSGKSSE